MKIQILGTGCPKCRRLEENARSAVRELGLDADVEKVADINDIISFGVMVTPGLAVDGDVKSTGKVLSVVEIKSLLG
jgi:small redox-active disulfide protein 2